MSTSRRMRASLVSQLAMLLALSTVPVIGNEEALFDRGSWIQTVSLGGYESVDDDRDMDLFDSRVGVGYYFLDGIAVVGEAHVSSIDGYRVIEGTGETLDASTSGVGAALLLRWHFLQEERWSSYLDLGWGLLATDEDFPPGGTSVNGTSQYGFGLTWRASDRIDLIAGARHLHVSNGKGLVDGNPSYDSLGGYLGAAIRLGRSEAVHSENRPRSTIRAGQSRPRILTQIELQVGEVDDHDHVGARVDLDFRVGDHWRVFLEATGAEISGDESREDTFTQLGLGLYRRSARSLLGLLVDRQEFAVFTSDRIEAQAEHHLADQATVVGLLGWEDRNLSPDRWRGAMRFRIYPTVNLLFEPGLAFADPIDDLDSNSIEATLNVEYQPPFLARFGVSLFFQDRADDLLLGGVRFAPGRRSDLRTRYREGVLQRVRF